MYTYDQHLLVIGSVEDADPAAFRQTLGSTPQKIMFKFRGTRMLETEHLAALRIDARHHMANGSVLAGRVHSLKNQQYRIAVGGIVQALQHTQLIHMFCEQFAVLLLRLVNWLHQRWPLL